jgi:hypothetical protein
VEYQAQEVTVPLSEHEQRVLEQMEQALSAEDPRFASQMLGKSRAGVQHRRTALGVVVAIVGLGLVILGVTAQQIWLGGIGFGAMVLGGFWTFTPAPARPKLGTVQDDGNISLRTGGTAGRKSRPKRSGFMERMEQRWERRREQGPF